MKRTRANSRGVVWQIAQRDYKFGKGKHSSLTKATYDAVGDRFRSLWGKEAGWAHSILFTADLKVFSERLLAKLERTEMEIKQDEDVTAEIAEVPELMTVKAVKREFEEEEGLEKLVFSTRAKRQRR